MELIQETQDIPYKKVQIFLLNFFCYEVLFRFQ